jgi:hypothetical protein
LSDRLSRERASAILSAASSIDDSAVAAYNRLLDDMFPPVTQPTQQQKEDD